MADLLESIHLETVDDRRFTVEIRDGKAWFPGASEGDPRPLPLRYAGDSNPFVLATCIRPVAPEDPHYALALQDALPDGILVREAVVSGRTLSWGELIQWALDRR